MTLTVREIEDRFEDAAFTLRRLPNPPGSGPKGFGHSWPDYIHDAHEAHADAAVRMRVIPSALSIQRMDECIDWLRFLDPEDARIVWLRAEGVRWRQVCIRAGVVRSTAWRRWAASLLTIANHLKANEKSGGKARAQKKVPDGHGVKPRQSGSGTLF